MLCGRLWRPRARSGRRGLPWGHAMTAMHGQGYGKSSRETAIESLLRLAQTHGIVVAPKPELGSVNEGWMSRIASVERLLAGAGDALPRLYVNPLHRDDRSPQASVRTDPDGSVEVRLDARWSGQFALLRQLVSRAPWVYVHTVHLARFVVPFLDRSRVFVDVHGIAPEEEALLGNPANAAYFEEVERRVWLEAEGIVTVTASMRGHLERKHGRRSKREVVLPIFEGSRVPHPPGKSDQGEPPAVIYAGGIQRWQCVDDMISLIGAVGNRARWIVLSHEAHEFGRRLEEHGLAGLVEVRSVTKQALEPYYQRADYGLVLRDPIAVNRVSCPTKLVEYLKHGIVPIVKSVELGDFPALGYRAVTLDEFLTGRLPTTAVLDGMRQANYTALERLAGEFGAARTLLLEWLRASTADRPYPSRPRLHEMSTIETTSGATAFAEIYEQGAAGQSVYLKVNSPTWEREKRFLLSGQRFQELRFTPVQGPFIARVDHAVFLTANGEEIPANVECRAAHGVGSLCVSTPDCPGSIVLTPRGPVSSPLREVAVWVDLIAEGPEAVGATVDAGAVPQIAREVGVWRDDIRARARHWVRTKLGV